MTADGNAYHLGIDLGTTYVAAGILQHGRPEIITLGDRTAVLPSVLYFKEDGEVLTGDSAIRRGLSDPTRVVREFKRRVGDTTPIIVGQTPYSVDVLTAKLLRHVYEAVVRRQGTAPQSTTITHPANWGPYKVDVLEQAVRLADIGEVKTITEPVAAAIHYAAAERLNPGETVAIYDLGGGTFDAAVLGKTDDDFTVLGEVEGIERLGGIDFDEAVFQHVVRFCESSLAELDMEDPAAMQALARLRQECVDAKEVLSTDTDVTIPVVLPNSQTEVRLTRGEFEAMIKPLLQQTVEALQRALRSAEVNAQDLSAVLLVGGSSRIPFISEMVGTELGRPIAVDRHPKHTVALGAAISAGRGDKAPEAKVDDWFRTDPTTTVNGTGGAAAAAAGMVVGAGSDVSGGASDPFPMFPLHDDEPAKAASATPAAATPAAEQAPAAEPVAAELSPAEKLGTAPIQVHRTQDIEVSAAQAPPAAEKQAADSPIVESPAAAAPSAPPSVPVVPAIPAAEQQSQAPAQAPVKAAPAVAPAAAPSFGSGASDPKLSFSNTGAGSGGTGGGGGQEHQLRMMNQPAKPPIGRVLAMFVAALIAVLLLGGGAYALTRTVGGGDDGAEIEAGEDTDQNDNAPVTASTIDGDPASPGADGEDGNDQGSGDQLGQQDGDGQTDTTQSNNTETTRAGDTTTTGRNTTTTEEDVTTTTERETTTTEEVTTTTEEVTTTVGAVPIRIVSGPRVNSVGPTSFQFNYSTNDVCGTGSFRVTEKGGGSAGSYSGDNVCFGPLHGGFPNGSPTFAGFNLSPGTTYVVTVTVRGTASDGTRTAGSGTDSASFEVTTSE